MMDGRFAAATVVAVGVAVCSRQCSGCFAAAGPVAHTCETELAANTAPVESDSLVLGVAHTREVVALASSEHSNSAEAEAEVGFAAVARLAHSVFEVVEVVEAYGLRLGQDMRRGCTSPPKPWYRIAQHWHCNLADFVGSHLEEGEVAAVMPVLVVDDILMTSLSGFLSLVK